VALVLVVEDREDNLALLGDIVTEQVRAEFIGVKMAQEALDVLSDVHPDAMIVDLALPGTMDGLELIAMVRAHIDPNMPILAVTALTEQYNEANARAAGCDAFSKKPFNVRWMRDTLKQWVGT
jgi:CheY-like chemotaxis protein